ncbi:glycosyltransferase family 2 protein [soil metagenome]
MKLPITAIIPTRNEESNLRACLASVAFCERVIVADSASTDATVAISKEAGAEAHQFVYTGGWPKKRQWAMDTLNIATPWTLLLDADERVTLELQAELARIVSDQNPADGFWITLRLVFLGRVLKHGGGNLRKLSFFRTGSARFECLIAEQTAEMADIEIHEHVMVKGREGVCRAPILHENVNSLFRYIEKHNEYSTWSAELARRLLAGEGAAGDARTPTPTGSQADRRRWMMNILWRAPCAGLTLPVLRFLYFYILRAGFLDGAAGFYYCGFKAVQAFHTMAKLRETNTGKARR